MIKGAFRESRRNDHIVDGRALISLREKQSLRAVDQFGTTNPRRLDHSRFDRAASSFFAGDVRCYQRLESSSSTLQTDRRSDRNAPELAGNQGRLMQGSSGWYSGSLL